MARKSPAEKLEALLRVTRAWERTNAQCSYYGYTLERFKQAIQPSLDARIEISELTQRLRVAIRERDDADAESLRLVRWISLGVRADPSEGDDGPLIESMGYAPWRRIGRPRRMRPRR